MLALMHRAIAPGEGHSAGRELLRQMVEDYTGQAMPEIALGRWGKPYFPDSSLQFSITHTKHHVFCALSDRPIGIDAEEIDRKISLSLAGKILAPAELAQFTAAADKPLALLSFWVLKEAAAKCEGTGLRGYPNHTNFVLDDPRVTTAHGCLLAVVE
jgi:phosphopantetheinyl transferase